MASYYPPKKGAAFTFYVGLVARASRPQLQAAPTLAAGDFQVSIDGGGFNNLATLPTVTPAAGKAVQISLSAAEMTGDNIVVMCSDVAGAQWDDLMICIQTTARQIDDLAFPTTSGRSVDVDASGGVEVGSFQAGAITPAAIATDAIDSDALAASATAEIAAAVWGFATRTLTSFGTLVASIWAHASRTLTQTAVAAYETMVGSTLIIKRGDTFSASITDLGALTGFSKLWFSVKKDTEDADSASVLMVLLSSPAGAGDGLQYLNGAPATAAQGNIVVTDLPTGDITITILPAATMQLTKGTYVYDIQMLVGGAVTTLVEADCRVEGDITRAVT